MDADLCPPKVAAQLAAGFSSIRVQGAARLASKSFASRRLGKLSHGVFIDADKLSQIHREVSVWVA
jgi:hypothetical protein